MSGGASQIELHQEFALRAVLRAGKVVTLRAFLAWRDAFEAVGLAE